MVFVKHLSQSILGIAAEQVQSSRSWNFPRSVQNEGRLRLGQLFNDGMATLYGNSCLR